MLSEPMKPPIATTHPTGPFLGQGDALQKKKYPDDTN